MALKLSDALAASSFVMGITSCSKEKILSCLSSMEHSDLQNLLLCFLKQIKHPFLEDIIEKNWEYSEDQSTQSAMKIKDFFINKNESLSPNNTNCNFIRSIPSQIVGYILSFSNMKDRLKYSLICKAFYKYCQIPMAKEHLVIDHAFAKALYYKTLDTSQFTNIKTLDINYAFSDSPVKTNKYIGFERTYYEIISDILYKSPELHTLNYHLSYKRFKYNIEERGVGDSGSGAVGHLFTWLSEINWYSNRRHFYIFSTHNIFENITKLTWTPSQPYISSYWGCGQRAWRESTHLFKFYFPKLQSLTIPKTKLYRQGFWHPPNDFGDKDLEWSLFKNNYFYDILEAMNVNMMPIYTRIHTRNGALYHVNITNNPLYYFYKFVNLKCLKLTLPIFEQCCSYYEQLWDDVLATKYGICYCLHLEKLELDFKMTNINQFVGRKNNLDPNIATDYRGIISRICKYILNRCPNVIQFAINTNGIVNDDDSFNYLIGYYGKLETLCTDSLGILSDIRLLALKKLVITRYKKIRNEKEIVNFSLFPNLESFQFIYNSEYDNDQNKLDLNQNIILFLTHMVNQKDIKHLKYLSFVHIYKKTSRKKSFYRFTNVKNSSKSICKLITALTTSTNNSITFIELNPVALQQKECEFVSFWFTGEFGLCETENLSNKTKKCTFISYK